jgi:hypothetical protein
MDWPTLFFLMAIVAAQLPCLLHKPPSNPTVLKEILGLSLDELKRRIDGTRKYVWHVGSISVVILAACIAALLSDLGVVAIFASVAVVGSLTYLFIQVCSDFRLLKLELCRREIMN